MGAPHNHRRLTLILSAFVLLSNSILAILFHRLPDDGPYHLASRLSIYSYFASALGALGFVGARRGNATLVAIFANYLLIDILICTIPRLLALSLFPSLRETICDADAIQNFIFSQSASSLPTTYSSSRYNFFWSTSPVPTVEDDPADRLASESEQLQSQCLRVVSIVQILVSVVVIGATVIQVICAVRVSAFASWLAKLEEQQSHSEQDHPQSPNSSICADGWVGRFRSGSGRSIFSDDSRNSGAWEREEEKRAELGEAHGDGVSGGGGGGGGGGGWRKC